MFNNEIGFQYHCIKACVLTKIYNNSMGLKQYLISNKLTATAAMSLGKINVLDPDKRLIYFQINLIINHFNDE